MFVLSDILLPLENQQGVCEMPSPKLEGGNIVFETAANLSYEIARPVQSAQPTLKQSKTLHLPAKSSEAKASPK